MTVLLVTAIAWTLFAGNDNKIMAVTGATPKALVEQAPSGIRLLVNGQVKQDYLFSGDTLNALASTRIRTREVSSDGQFLGAYVYTGIPVLHILEGIQPVKSKDAAFDRPLDMVVMFTSTMGESVTFSYGEIIFMDDSLPVTLVFDRKEVLPTKNPEKYRKNRFKQNISGLRLISPKDPDTSRYLDDVKTITLLEPTVTYENLPKMKKGLPCRSGSITCIWEGKSYQGSFKDVPRQTKNNWIRVGHGRGYKGVFSVKGYTLHAFLKKNFPYCQTNHYFLFVGCDGYRCLFSGREIFDIDEGESILISDEMNGKAVRGGLMLAPVEDYFIDRAVWGLSHIVVLDDQSMGNTY